MTDVLDDLHPSTTFERQLLALMREGRTAPVLALPGDTERRLAALEQRPAVVSEAGAAAFDLERIAALETFCTEAANSINTLQTQLVEAMADIARLRIELARHDHDFNIEETVSATVEIGGRSHPIKITARGRAA